MMATTSITGFHEDAAGEWIAELACGHAQHMRHRPPWQNRAWVMREEGRTSMLHTTLECRLCTMPELPPAARTYKRTPSFTESSIPAGLLQNHRTRPGVWGRIVVEAGQLEYAIVAPARAFVLTPDCPGVIAPEEPHFVKPLGAVVFHVAFMRIEEP